METRTYTIDGRTYTVRCTANQLQHFGVKGMKWGRRKARPQPIGMPRRSASASTNSAQSEAERQQARKTKLKRTVKIGAAVAAAGLAIYGAKKLNTVVRDKNYQVRMKQAKQHVDSYMNSTLFSTPAGASKRDLITVQSRRDNFVREVVDNYGRKAHNDSFGTAVKNVVGNYIDERRRGR